MECRCGPLCDAFWNCAIQGHKHVRAVTVDHEPQLQLGHTGRDFERSLNYAQTNPYSRPKEEIDSLANSLERLDVAD
jgi:hypothetical protein